MADNVATAPSGAQTKKTEPKEVSGDSAIKDSRPGTTQAPAIHFDDLGPLSEFPETTDTPNVFGVGTPCVILSDVLVGAEGGTYTKGQIHRISKLVHGYEDEDKTPVKAQIKRLMSLKAIRPATPEEIEAGFATVTVDSESEATQAERTKRLEAELELNALKVEMARLQKIEPAAPGTKGTKDPFEDQ